MRSYKGLPTILVAVVLLAMALGSQPAIANTALAGVSTTHPPCFDPTDGYGQSIDVPVTFWFRVDNSTAAVKTVNLRFDIERKGKPSIPPKVVIGNPMKGGCSAPAANFPPAKGTQCRLGQAPTGAKFRGWICHSVRVPAHSWIQVSINTAFGRPGTWGILFWATNGAQKSKPGEIQNPISAA